ncbi:MAG: TolC family protein [Bdellovibrionaceae bacterium]|nr:TolC family protein [Pseudobdellovibrionaceae bacterium]
MKFYIIVIMSVFAFSGIISGKEKVVLSEEFIKKSIENEPPGVQQIQGSFLAVKNELQNKNDRFGYQLNIEGKSFNSDERLLSNFDGGVVKSSSAYLVGLQKPTQYGVDIGLKAFSNKSTNAFINDAATTGVSFSLAVDLYQNFLGRSTSNDFKKSELSLKRAELEKKTQLKGFESNVRKLYWALVANNEQKVLLSSLVKMAEKQYQEVLKRNKQGVADIGEVARYRSEWTTRKANLLSIGYQRSTLLKAIKELLPGLSDKEIQLAQLDIKLAKATVLACTAKISSYKDSPLEFTNYDDIINFLNKEEQLESKIVDTYGNTKIKLVGEYSSVGRDYGYEASNSNFSSDSQPRKSLGLQISIPLGSRTGKNRDVKKLMVKKRYKAQKVSQLLKVKAYHEQTVEMITILQEVLRSQRDTNLSLDKSLKISRIKYKQARISLQELISEQDFHLRSRLGEIETNLTIINALMDYFSVYTDIPCEFNRI